MRTRPAFSHGLRSFLPCRSSRVSRFGTRVCSKPLATVRFYCGAPCAPLASLRILDIQGPPVGYREAWTWQHAIADELRRDADAPDTLIVLEHKPVYTLGTRSAVENVLFNGKELPCDQDDGTTKEGAADMPQLVRTERGGEVTYHGPGQLVAYPILNLNRHRRDLHWYMRQLEETVIGLLGQEYGVIAGRKDGLTGVWVGDGKLAAIGLKVSKWVTMHGVALNVDMELDPFDRIVPCGIDDDGLFVTNVAQVADPAADSSLNFVRRAYVRSFSNVFGPYEPVLVQGDDARFFAEELASRQSLPRLHRR